MIETQIYDLVIFDRVSFIRTILHNTIRYDERLNREIESRCRFWSKFFCYSKNCRTLSGFTRLFLA